MGFTDLLRLTVFLVAGEATALGAITVISASQKDDVTTLAIAAGWWLIATGIGLYLGRPSAAADGVRDALARAKTAVSLPNETAGRIAFGRLWPIAVTAVAAGVLGVFLPGVAAIGAGYALLVALAWRTREAAVLGVEGRDGVRSTSSRARLCARSSWFARPALAATGCPPGTRRRHRRPRPEAELSFCSSERSDQRPLRASSVRLFFAAADEATSRRLRRRQKAPARRKEPST